jgi:predicted Zn-dependent protease
MPELSPASSFAAGAFHPSQGTRRVAGTLRLEGGSAHFAGETLTFSLPLDGVSVRLGGASDRLIFFEHASAPGVSVFTSDRAVLEHPAFAQNPLLGQARGQIRRRHFAARSLVLAVSVALVLALAGLWLAKDSMVEKIAGQVPAAWEQKLGEAAFVHFSLGKKFITEPAVTGSLEQLAAPLLKAVPHDRYAFTLHLVEDASLNAFALPGGKVVLHTGLLLAADSPEEVLGVLAHELAHVTRQHGVRGIVQGLGLYATVSLFIGDVSGVAAILVNNAPFLLTQKFSRDHEREADEVGFRSLEAAGIDPRGMISFFEKLRQEEAKLKAQVPGGAALDALGFLSTHPATAERAQHLEALLAASPRQDGFSRAAVDFKAFQQAVRAQLSQPDSAPTNSALPDKNEKP